MYAKIFEQIYDSSIAEDYTLRLVFQDLLILSDQDGIVDITHEAISRRTNVPLDIVKTAIDKLESPDPKSRNPEDEGRRIIRIDEHRDWGWQIVNYETYRNMASTEQRRALTRERVRKHRASHSKTTPETPCNAVKRPVTLGNACNAIQKQKQKHKQKQKEQGTKESLLGKGGAGGTPLASNGSPAAPQGRSADKPAAYEELRDYGIEIGMSVRECQACFDYWESAGWRRKGGVVRDWKATVRVWASRVKNEKDREERIQKQRQERLQPSGPSLAEQEIERQERMTEQLKKDMGYE